MAAIFCKAVSAVASTACRNSFLLGHLLHASLCVLNWEYTRSNCSKNGMNEWAYATVQYTLETMSMVQRVKYKQEVSPIQGPSRMP